MRTRILFPAAVLSLVLGLGFFFTTPAAADPAPNWQLKDLQGKTVSLADFKGKVVVLDFWATWCPPCAAEIPHFVELQKEYGDQGLVIVGVSQDQGGPGAVKGFVRRNHINYPIVMGDDATNEQYGGIQGIPTTFVIDRAGNIVAKHLGYTDKAVFAGEIQPLLAAKA